MNNSPSTAQPCISCVFWAGKPTEAVNCFNTWSSHFQGNNGNLFPDFNIQFPHTRAELKSHKDIKIRSAAIKNPAMISHSVAEAAGVHTPQALANVEALPLSLLSSLGWLFS
jgi:hypothetical protein